ncbi:hypothetical protein E1B28_007390 [Marasmius oreades]|uniref:DUF914-domain-containing protein n=1 Tax=Marasmius oreades TaxID=181124 RepID=A0A9P7UVS0_9AGAR|nr:uncharacterized protein E1B28_007390 [Marasmius oreades]KAG7093739.1 hypothetical protein E1B28_007390 [Marasmius oreades]
MANSSNDHQKIDTLDIPPEYDARSTKSDEVENPPIRPKRLPIEYSSPSAFFRSVGRRFSMMWTKRFFLSLLAGQLVSLCITCTNVTTTELAIRGWALPTTQSLFLYFTLFIIYTPFTIYRYGLKGWAEMVFRDGWKYFILAAADVEANFMVVKAYQYTDLLSCMLLDAMAIPSCLFFSWLWMRTKYHWTQLLGVIICLGGLAMLVGSDIITDKTASSGVLNRAEGDGFMIAGAILYGFTNATEELFVRKRPLYEVVGQLGMWGVIISIAQAGGLEARDYKLHTWNGATVGLILTYTVGMLILYTVAPLLYRMASSAYYNLSILSADFYGLLFGLFLYHYRPYWLYFVSFAVVILGLITYFWWSAPEEQGKLIAQAPEYVQERRENLRGRQKIAGNV